VTPLARAIAAEIAATGPMRLDRFMALCLGHPEHGYYMAREPFGRAGDFTTAPEISQMFGELLGLWAAQVWHDMGRPPALRLVELGPGRGTLMADALRAARALPGFPEAAEVWLVETSPRLRALQAQAVPRARHAASLDAVPPGPMILLANEFFDALPIRQFHRRDGLWHERVVGLAGDRLAFGLGPAAGTLPEPAPEGAVLEIGAQAEAAAQDIGARLARDGGAALVIDYGAEPPATGGGDTFQAVAAHGPADPLAAPGQADLTAHVDFAALAAALRAGGAAVCPLVAQGALLGALGLATRAARLAAARPDRADAMAAEARRLSDPAAMGTLFKALAATGPGQPPPPGFGAPR
jgi:SAM-dependent MidA family methyltransferase